MNLPDALLAQAKRRAAETGRTVTSLMEEALRQLLSRSPESLPSEVSRLPTYGDASATALVDISDRDALWAALGVAP